MAWHPDNRIRYLGMFILNACNAASGSCVLAFAANNVVSHSKRSVLSALLVTGAGISSVIAAPAFRSQDYPKYIPGLVTVLALQAFLIVITLLLMFRHWYWNKQSRLGYLSSPLEGQKGFYYTL